MANIISTALKITRKFLYRFPIVFYAVFSTFVLIFINASSPLYNYNPSPSPNMFLTIGRGIFDGMVPYRDIWDGKGFAVFFLVGLFGKMFPGIYLGQWILSCISVTLTGYFIYKSALLVAKERRHAHVVSILCLCLLLYQSRMYIVGGVSDEYIAPVVACLLYYSLTILNGSMTKVRDWIAFGVCCGLLFWMKFTICAAPFIVLVFYAINKLKMRHISDLLKEFLWMCVGGGIISLPILIYFEENASLHFLFYGYYQFHAMYHPISGVRGLIINLAKASLSNPLSFIILGIGLTKLLYNGIRDRRQLVMSLSCMGLIVCVYMSASIHYYFMAILPYTVFGMTYLLEGKSFMSRFSFCLSMAVLIISSASLYPYKGESRISLSEIRSQKDEIQAIASFVMGSKDHSIMYFGLMESGCYHFMGEYPTLLYYQQVNYDPLGKESQQEHIRRKTCNFVLVRRIFNKSGEDVTKTSDSYLFAADHGYAQVDKKFTDGIPTVMLLQRENSANP